MENKILASVGGMPITEGDVDAFFAELGPRGRAYNTPEGRGMILDRLIGNKLLLLDAKRNLFEAEPAFKDQRPPARKLCFGKSGRCRADHRRGSARVL